MSEKSNVRRRRKISSSDMESEKENGPGPSGTVKKSMKRKHVRTWDNIIKQICNLSEEEKLKFLKEKFTELLMENQTMSTLLRNSEKHTKQLEKELEQSRAELAKNILAKSKLENIARELQKQNRDIKEESYNRLKEEEEKRREVASNFTEKLNNLTQLMNENKGKSNHLREENDNMTSKLSELYDQFQERETHLANMNKQMELQKKLSDTQLKKLEFEFEAEREIWKKERTMFLVKLQKSDDTNKVLQENVKSLQQHLDSYQKQYSDFESTMKRSNKVFDSFKEEMTKMQKANSALEKDRNEWHGRWKGSTQKLLQLTELNQAASNELKTVQKKMDALEKLCRKLQLERSYYLQRLRQHNIDLIAPGDLECPMPSTSQLSPSFAVSEISDRPPQEPIEVNVKIESVEDEASENECPVYPEAIDCASDDSVMGVNTAGNPYDDTTSPNTDIEDYIQSPHFNDEDVQTVGNVNDLHYNIRADPLIDRRNGSLHVQNSPNSEAENQENGEDAENISPLNVIPDSSTDHVINLNGVETDDRPSNSLNLLGSHEEYWEQYEDIETVDIFQIGKDGTVFKVGVIPRSSLPSCQLTNPPFESTVVQQNHNEIDYVECLARSSTTSSPIDDWQCVFEQQNRNHITEYASSCSEKEEMSEEESEKEAETNETQYDNVNIQYPSGVPQQEYDIELEDASSCSEEEEMSEEESENEAETNETQCDNVNVQYDMYQPNFRIIKISKKPPQATQATQTNQVNENHCFGSQNNAFHAQSSSEARDSKTRSNKTEEEANEEPQPATRYLNIRNLNIQYNEYYSFPTTRPLVQENSTQTDENPEVSEIQDNVFDLNSLRIAVVRDSTTQTQTSDNNAIENNAAQAATSGATLQMPLMDAIYSYSHIRTHQNSCDNTCQTEDTNKTQDENRETTSVPAFSNEIQNSESPSNSKTADKKEKTGIENNVKEEREDSEEIKGEKEEDIEEMEENTEEEIDEEQWSRIRLRKRRDSMKYPK